MLVPLNLYSRRVTLIVVFGEGGIGRDAVEGSADISKLPNRLEFACGVEKLSGAKGVNGSCAGVLGDEGSSPRVFHAIGDASSAFVCDRDKRVVFKGGSRCTFAEGI